MARLVHVLAVIAAASSPACCYGAVGSTRDSHALPSTTGAAAAARPWMADPSAPVSERVEALLAQMTITDKLWQLHRPNWDPSLPTTGVGVLEYNSVFNADTGNATAVVAARNAIQQAFLSSGPGARLGIPASFRLLAIHGAEAYGTTFPEGPGLGASWDPALVAQVGGAIAAEARALGADMFLPVINLWSDARFGRQEEGFSEEPTLTSAYAAALVAGAQGSLTLGPWDYLDNTTSTIATLFKHVGAYGVAAGGMNGGRADVPEHTVREQYLKAWRRAAASGARGVMPSHNSVLSTPAHGSTWLLRDRLRGDFNWSQGVFISDTGDVAALAGYRLCASDASCAALALNAGVDIEQVPGHTYLALPQAIAQNLTTQRALDDAVRRVLGHKFSLRLFDQPYTDESLAASVVNSAGHRDLALQAPREGIVLLANSGGNALPLNPSGQLRVAVVGPNGGCGTAGNGAGTLPLCDAQASMVGNYAEGSPPPTGVQTVAEAIAAAGYAASVSFNRGCNINDSNTTLIPAAVAAAAAADVTVAVLGDSTTTCGEGFDRDSLDLPGAQLQLLQAVVGTGKPVVVVLIHCRTATFGAATGNALLGSLAGLLTAWRPGQMGGQAVAEVLFGLTNPSGRLPMSWVRSAGQANGPASPWLQERVALWGGPATGAEGRTYNGYVQASNPATPLFPFGYGLSYTSFALSGLSVGVQVTANPSGSAPTGNLAYPLVVNVTVTNTGSRAGAAVVQVYVQDPVGMGLTIRPWKRLLAFARTPVLPPGGGAGSRTTLSLPVRADDLGFPGDCPQDCSTLKVWPGQYTVSAGFDSVNDDGQGQVVPVTVPQGYAVGLWA